MDEKMFLARTKSFGLRIIRLVRSLPSDAVAQTLGKQLLRSGTSVGANYRSACRARSRPDIIAKLKIAEEEVDESAYWMEMLVESGSMAKRRLTDLMKEADEITAMFVASIKTLRARSNGNKSKGPLRKGGF